MTTATTERFPLISLPACRVCGVATADVKLREEWVGGHGLVSFYECSKPDARCVWVYAHTSEA